MVIFYFSKAFLRAIYYEGVSYFYIKNILGIIEKVIDGNGDIIVSYTYDSWGKLLNKVASGVGVSTLIASINPFIYKSYYYDKETGWFWLSSRYYSPELCRFISLNDVSYLDS